MLLTATLKTLNYAIKGTALDSNLQLIFITLGTLRYALNNALDMVMGRNSNLFSNIVLDAEETNLVMISPLERATT